MSRSDARSRRVLPALAELVVALVIALVLALLLALLLGPTRPAAAQAGITLQPERSEITFTTRQMGVPVEGRFTRFAARITLDPRQPEAGSVALDIDTASARFGAPELDAEVVKPAWLAAARFAQASFRSSGIRTAGPGRFEVAGRLTLKGQARDIVVPVQLQQQGSSGSASGSFVIRRLAFNVGEGDWTDTSLLADEVQVRFRLALAGLAPP